MGVWRWLKDEEGWKIALFVVVLLPIGIFSVILEDREEQREKSHEAYIENCEWVDEDEHERQKACDRYRDWLVEKYGAASLLEAIVVHDGGEYYDGVWWAASVAFALLLDLDENDPRYEEYVALYELYDGAKKEALAKSKLQRIYRERAQEKKLTN